MSWCQIFSYNSVNDCLQIWNYRTFVSDRILQNLNDGLIRENSLHFNGHFPGRPKLASTRMSPFWILLEPKVMKETMITGAIRRAKLQSNRHHQQTDTQLFTGRMPFPSPITNNVRVLNEKCERKLQIAKCAQIHTVN